MSATRNCKYCDTPLAPRQDETPSKWNTRKFCSREHALDYRRLPPRERPEECATPGCDHRSPRYAGGVCISCHKGRPVKAAHRWLIPEDGIVDELAVEIAASGVRRVRLTAREMDAAALRIRAMGLSVNVAVARTGIDRARVLELMGVQRSGVAA